MGEQVFDSNRWIVRRGRLHAKPRQLLGHPVVELNLALLAELHDSRACEQLAVRRHTEPGVELHRSFCLDVGEPEAPRPYQFLVGHHPDRDTRKTPALDLTREPRREEPGCPLNVGILARTRVLCDDRRRNQKEEQASTTAMFIAMTFTLPMDSPRVTVA